ncbi:MAG TPA: CarD family transcriptional regulator [Alphaproteobacteria bacterium]|nr:CarD family transcriptional regulator [Alphaproteobacteria bacterium]
MAKTTKAKAKPTKKPAATKKAVKAVKKTATLKKAATKKAPVKATSQKTKATASKKTTKSVTKVTSVKTAKTPAKATKPAVKKAAPKAEKKAAAPKAVKETKQTAKVVKEVAVKEIIKESKMKAAPAPKAEKKPVAAPAPAPVPEVAKKPEKLDFAAGDFVVYPAHGVGFVEGVETQTIAGMDITLYTISFEKDRMRLKLPVSKVKASGLRKLSSKDRLKDALATLQGRSQTRRIMWSRRAQEYEAKINSGDPVSIAEVLRDLKRADDQSEQSYSERQIYQAALERLAREVAAIEKIDEKKAAEKLEAVLSNVA